MSFWAVLLSYDNNCNLGKTQNIWNKKVEEELMEREEEEEEGKEEKKEGRGWKKLITAHVVESNCQQHPSQNSPNPFIWNW